MDERRGFEFGRKTPDIHFRPNEPVFYIATLPDGSAQLYRGFYVAQDPRGDTIYAFARSLGDKAQRVGEELLRADPVAPLPNGMTKINTAMAAHLRKNRTDIAHSISHRIQALKEPTTHTHRGGLLSAALNDPAKDPLRLEVVTQALRDVEGVQPISFETYKVVEGVVLRGVEARLRAMGISDKTLDGKNGFQIPIDAYMLFQAAEKQRRDHYFHSRDDIHAAIEAMMPQRVAVATLTDPSMWAARKKAQKEGKAHLDLSRAEAHLERVLQAARAGVDQGLEHALSTDAEIQELEKFSIYALEMTGVLLAAQGELPPRE